MEALFSMLQSRFDLDGAVLLDLFAGSGALGIEELSRGAARWSSSRGSRGSPGAGRQPGGVRLRAARTGPPAAGGAPSGGCGHGERFDGVLLDPRMGADWPTRPCRCSPSGWTDCRGGWVAAEHHVDDVLAVAYGALRLTATRRYGKTAVALFSDSRMVEQVAAS
jgi:16S rRNA (guanine966-N2)-methyltransferase